MSTISVMEYPLRPGAVQVTVNVDAGATGTFDVVRVEETGDVVPIRSAPAITPGAVVEFVDVEASFHRATYALRRNGNSIASASIALPPLSNRRALIRSVLRLGDEMDVTLVDEVGMGYGTSSAVHAIIGSSDPIVISDVRRRRQGTYVLLTNTIAEADRLLELLKDGNPLLMRTCPDPAHPARDGYFYALHVGEARYGRRGHRIFDVDYQTVSAVKGELALPPPVSRWTYADLKAQTTAPTYGDLDSTTDGQPRKDYFQLFLDPVTP